MDKRLFDAVTLLTAVILLPLVGVSAVAYFRGQVSFDAYTGMWAEPVALLLGFWLRGYAPKDG